KALLRVALVEAGIGGHDVVPRGAELLGDLVESVAELPGIGAARRADPTGAGEIGRRRLDLPDELVEAVEESRRDQLAFRRVAVAADAAEPRDPAAETAEPAHAAEIGDLGRALADRDLLAALGIGHEERGLRLLDAHRAGNRADQRSAGNQTGQAGAHVAATGIG